MAGWKLRTFLVSNVRMNDGTVKTATRPASFTLELPPYRQSVVKEEARKVIEKRGLRYRSASFAADEPNVLVVYAYETAPLQTKIEPGRVFREPPKPPKF